ncbi:DUF6538 domain-containing protein [Vibrio rhizosphaerae]|uniref:DUF6538 domain-containing protein n=1 Tax=Vibrio rhizosphaerae TaxID=398736 RepID=A0ABU4IT93_9VIBR|nr:DUF6538 domain-containing protein [Vibrio rhizosphaerae]MDW6092510.1 DUF6538 domain-containing protein [Vibrio rhizosphaerae]
MRYLSQRSSGIWYFRYQIPLKLQPHFSGKTEIKKSLHTRCRNTARLRASKIQQMVWENLILIEKGDTLHPNFKALFMAMSEFSHVGEREVWGFSDGEKRKIIKKLTDCLEKLESEPMLLRAQRTRLELRQEDSSTFIESVDVICSGTVNLAT